MNILSLLPSATELVFALGLGDDLVGVTDRCDYPDEVASKPVVSRSLLPPEASDPHRSDALVEAPVGDGGWPASIDRDLLRDLEPDVILTRDPAQVQAVLDRLGRAARVVVLDPQTLDEVWDSFLLAGTALERATEATELADAARARVAAIRETTSRLPAFDVLAMEWPDPPWVAGRWTPEMIEVAGGTPLLAAKGKPGTRRTWKEVEDAAPEIVAFIPYGYYIEEAEDAAYDLFDNGHFVMTPAVREGNVFAFDASATFSRPGPRLIDGLEALAWAIHPEAFPEPPAGTVTRVGR